MTFHNPIHEGTPPELKSEAEGLDVANTDVADVVAKAIEGIRTDVAERLTALETKSAGMEKRLSRPAIVATPADAPAAIERKAFASFVRRGIERVGADEQKALTVSNDQAGGYLAPEEFANELVKLTTQFSPIRQYARVITTGAQAVKYPRRVSGMTATWTDETAERTQSEPVYEQITLTPYELATYVPFSVQLLEDSAFNIEGELALEFAEAFGLAEGAAFVKGTGAGQPKGLLTATGIKIVKTGAAAGFPAANPADVIVGMFHALPSVHAANGVWLANQATIGLMRTWKDGTGRYLLLDPVKDGAPTTLLGRPVVEAPEMPNVAAGTTPIMFGDLAGYRIVDRVLPSFLRDPYTMAKVGQILIHGRKRVGADVTHPDRFVKLTVAV